jgi:hypothetical protein
MMVGSDTPPQASIPGKRAVVRKGVRASLGILGGKSLSRTPSRVRSYNGFSKIGNRDVLFKIHPVSTTLFDWIIVL